MALAEDVLLVRVGPCHWGSEETPRRLGCPNAAECSGAVFGRPTSWLAPVQGGPRGAHRQVSNSQALTSFCDDHSAALNVETPQ